MKAWDPIDCHHDVSNRYAEEETENTNWYEYAAYRLLGPPSLCSGHFVPNHPITIIALYFFLNFELVYSSHMYPLLNGTQFCSSCISIIYESWLSVIHLIIDCLWLLPIPSSLLIIQNNHNFNQHNDNQSPKSKTRSGCWRRVRSSSSREFKKSITTLVDIIVYSCVSPSNCNWFGKI